MNNLVFRLLAAWLAVMLAYWILQGIESHDATLKQHKEAVEGSAIKMEVLTK